MMLLIIIAVGILLLGIWFYNRQVSLRNRTLEAWSGIDVQLKRRHDLIPNLVEVVKGYSHYEGDLLKQVVLTRTQAVRSTPSLECAQAEKELGKGLRSLLAIAEAYPNLKADQQFLTLQNTLTKVEDELQMARRYYNGTIRDYNTSIQSFPGNMIAKLVCFKAGTFFEIEYATERSVPDVAIS